MIEYFAPIKSIIDIIGTLYKARRYVDSEKNFFLKLVAPYNRQISLIVADYFKIICDLRNGIDASTSKLELDKVINEFYKSRVLMAPLRYEARALENSVVKNENLVEFQHYFYACSQLMEVRIGGREPFGDSVTAQMRYCLMEMQRMEYNDVDKSKAVNACNFITSWIEAKYADICREYARLTLEYGEHKS